MTITRKLCEKIAATTADSMGETAIAKARQVVLDGIAVAVAGARIEEAPKILANYLRGQGSKPDCSALGFGFRLASVPAALLNATSMHVLVFEPMWTPATHALSPALAPVLTLAESIGAHGRDVLAAVIKGVEIQGWIRLACGRAESRDFKFHPPGMVGPIGAAVAASHLLKLDATKLASQCDRYRDVALWQPHQQYRNHDQVDTLRLCGVARSRIGAARGRGLHGRR